MAVLGFDLGPLRSAIAELGQGVRQGAQQAPAAGPGGDLPGGGDYLGYLAHLAPPPAADFRPPQAAPQAGPGDYLGQLGQLATSRGAPGAVMSTFAGLGQLGTGGPGQFMADLAALADRFTAQKASAIGSAVGKGAAAVGSTVTSGGGPSSGMEPGVAQWANQAQQTFGGLVDPDVMLAIMTNESHGNPAAYNGAGNAWGLFQQVGLGSNDPQVQFASARALAEQKLAGINAAYAAHGLNPDERTRARDFALAWAGHFDYDTGLPNPNSRDVGSGQTAAELADVFLGHYDAIKAGRRQAGAGGGGAGFAPVTGGQVYPVMQGFGATDYAAQNAATYGYETQFGMQPGQHTGIDWAAPVGTKVYSPFAGRVVYAGGTGYYTDTMDNVDPAHAGEYMVQLDNGDQIILGHLSNISAQVGQRVNAGDFVGLSGGSDGAHVHIEVRVPDPSTPSGYRIVDPTAYFGQR